MKKDKKYQELEIDVIELMLSDVISTAGSWEAGEDELPFVPAT